MFKKNLLILLFLLVCSCGYTPMTEYKLKSDINIVINEIKGDEEINNIYKKIANSYARNESQKKLFLNIDTNFTKTIISKDLKGNASDYRLTINSVFTTDNKKTISITKDFIVKKFDEIDYCKNCDFLYDDPEVMVWTNDKSAQLNHMLGTDKDFILTKYAATK